MSAQPAVSTEPTMLDQGESRFPLDLDVKVPKIRNLYNVAIKNQWDPKKDIDWDLLDLSKFTEEQLMGARVYWSRRAWSEYGAIAESPALLIRFCQDGLNIDAQLFFAIRSQEETRHAEACYLMAEHLGGYMEQPLVVDYEAAVATHGVLKMALDPDAPIEATIAALVCGAEEVAFDVFRHLAKITTDPVALQIIKLISKDEIRHCAFGWALVGSRIETMGTDEIKAIEDAVINMIENVELKGYHSSWLAPESPATKAEMEADRLTWEAGLGATVEELEKPVFIDTVRRIRRQMEPWGVHLPIFEHPKLGAF